MNRSVLMTLCLVVSLGLVASGVFAIEATIDKDAPQELLKKLVDVNSEFAKAMAIYGQGDKAKAFQAVSDCAEKGHPDAQTQLGQMLYKGEGTPKDLNKALVLLKRGYDGSRKLLKIEEDADYTAGIEAGKNKNYDVARQRFLASGQSGNPDGHAQLAKMAATGLGQPKDPEKAYQHLMQAHVVLSGIFKSLKADARKKACFANQRVLLGAVEMYNMDHPEMIHAITHEMTGETGMLVTEKYLKTGLQSPEPECQYSSEGDLAQDGKIKCSFHGSVP